MVKKKAKKKTIKKKATAKGNATKSPLTDSQIKEFKAAEREAKDFTELNYVVDDLAKAGDKEWARKVYEKAEKNSDLRTGDIDGLAESLFTYLGDEKWSRKVFKKAEKMANNDEDYSSPLYVVAGKLNTILGDEEWADNLAEAGDKEWAIGILKKVYALN